MSNITFSTCLYQLKNRHGPSSHIRWMRYFIRIVVRFYLVIYTDDETYDIIFSEVQKLDIKTIERIKIVIQPYTEFYNYKYRDFWINNNNNPECKLNGVADWRLNMLWCEKVHFVYQTINRQYFNTEYYGWCDIGYFRDILADNEDQPELSRDPESDYNYNYAKSIRDVWPNPSKINALNKTQIYYGSNVDPENSEVAFNYYHRHFHSSNIDKSTLLPKTIYHKKLYLISGGFFITGRAKMKWWVNTFQTTLEQYIKHNAVVQDDQQIISNCIFKGDSNKHFCIIKLKEVDPDKLWFMFRDLLL